MKIEIDDIVIKKRIRKNLGDLSQLMLSMKKHGLLNPVIITAANELVAGHRRLEAAKRLGWKDIEVQVMTDIDEIEKLELEIDENIQRRNLTTEELAEGYARLEKLKHPSVFKRIRKCFKNVFKKIFRRRR